MAPDSPSAQTRPRRWLGWAAGTAAAALVLAALAAGWVAAAREARLGEVAREMARTREALRQTEAALREQVAAYRRAVDLLRDPATRVVDLRGLGPGRGARGRVVWNDAAGGYLFVAGLPGPPPGRAYALWALAGATPRPAGLLRLDASGAASQRVEPVAGAPAVTAFAVTLEPGDGGLAPTGPRVLVSR